MCSFFANAFGEPEENAAAVLSCCWRPGSGIKGSFRGGDSAIHVLFVCLRDLGHYFFRRRLHHREIFSVGTLNKLAIDVHLVSSNCGLRLACHNILPQPVTSNDKSVSTASPRGLFPASITQRRGYPRSR